MAWERWPSSAHACPWRRGRAPCVLVSDLLAELVRVRWLQARNQASARATSTRSSWTVSRRRCAHVSAARRKERTRAWHFFEYVEGTSTKIISTTPFTSIMLQLGTLPTPASVIRPLAPATRTASPSRVSHARRKEGEKELRWEKEKKKIATVFL
jgi:hypothetical protein